MTPRQKKENRSRIPHQESDRFRLGFLRERHFPFSSSGIFLNFMKIQHQADALSAFPICCKCSCVFVDVCNMSVCSPNYSSWCRVMGRFPDACKQACFFLGVREVCPCRNIKQSPRPYAVLGKAWKCPGTAVCSDCYIPWS